MASINRLVRLKTLGSFLKVRHAWLSSPALKTISISSACSHQNILYGAVCVERLPVITAERSNLEKKFSSMLSQIELENSYLSDHEIRLIKEAEMAKKTEDSEDAVPEGEAVTGLDLEDIWEAELRQFVSAARETEADRTNNRQSLERKLDSGLYLLVRQNIGGNDHWVLPQALWEQGETLRQTAERALSTTCGQVKATFLGNAPCAVAKFDPKDKDDKRKVKLFFYKAWYKEGNITPDKKVAKDYLWVTKKELPEYCHNSYQQHLKKFIFEL